MAALHKDKAVFLCHAGENKAFVRQLVDRLENDGLKKDEIFYDEISLQPGDELDSIIKVIESPSLKLFVFVVSKYCFQVNKIWIRAEWEAALVNNKQIFPIWLDDNNDDFKEFGNLVRVFSYKLRKVIAQRVNPQEISTSLPGLSEKICSLVSGDQRTKQIPPPSIGNALPVQRQSIMPDVLLAKLKLEFVQKSYSQVLDKAEALFDDDTLKNEERLKEADKIFHRFKARVESVIPTGCFIFNLRFFQPCNVDEFYHEHFRFGPASLSAALTHLLITDQMRAAANGAELMVRVEVRYNDYIRVRRQLCMAGILKSTSVDNLSSLVRSSTERSIENPRLEGLDLAVTSTEDLGFSEWVAHPGTLHLVNRVRKQSQHVTSLESRLEMARYHAEIQENIVKSLHREITRLNQKDEAAQKVLLNKTEEIDQLQKAHKDQETEIEELRSAKVKWLTKGLEEVSVLKGTGQHEKPALDKLRESHLKPLPKGCTHHIMISYSHEQKKKVFKIRKHLVKVGYMVWIDEGGISGTIARSISTAIQEAAIVLIAFSEDYVKSPFCKREVNFAQEKKKEIVPLKMTDYTPDDWLGLLLAGILYVDFAPTQSFTDKLQELEFQIENRLEKLRKTEAKESL